MLDPRIRLIPRATLTTLPAIQLFGAPHLTAIATSIALPILLAWRTRDRKSLARKLAVWIAGFLVFSHVSGLVQAFIKKDLALFLAEDMPLHVCDIAVYAVAFTLLGLGLGRPGGEWRIRSERLFGVLYFWAMVGTLNALITPDSQLLGFPSLEFIIFFMIHGGLVAATLFGVLSLRLRPRAFDILRSWVVLNLVIPIVAVLNLILGGNYMYLRAPPATSSPFIVGDWPWYLAALEALALAFFALAYLPFVASRMRRRRTEGA